MTGERWQEIRTVLEAALPMDSEKRRAYLDQACASDQSLRDEVESLLAADKQAQTGFLQSPPLAIRLEKGTRLGDYEIQSLLGAGGMGEVYRARDLRLRRDVAVKILPAVVSADPERLRRFEQEAMADQRFFVKSRGDFPAILLRKSSNRPQRLGWTDHAQRCEDE